MPQAKGPQGRRQRRIARRRQHILAAAARVFASKGLTQATTKAIADEADVAEGTLYNYFKNKKIARDSNLNNITSKPSNPERVKVS